MKNTALILTFLILAVMGGMMVVFENQYGEYFLLASVFLGLYFNLKDEFGGHDCSDHEKTISRSFSQYGDTGVVFNMGKEVKCSKCGKTRTT